MSSELNAEGQALAGISPGLVRMSVGYFGTLEQKWSQLEKALSRIQEPGMFQELSRESLGHLGFKLRLRIKTDDVWCKLCQINRKSRTSVSYVTSRSHSICSKSVTVGQTATTKCLDSLDGKNAATS